MRWILEENSEAVLQAVDLHFGRLDGRQRRVNCLVHCRKQNQTLNWFSQCTKFERYGTVFDMNANHELTAQIAKMFAVLNLCHVSSDVPKQNEQNSEVSTFFRSSTSPTAVILKGLPTNSKPPLPSCKVLHKPLPGNQSLDWRRHERMAEGNLLIKFCLNRPPKS